MIMFPVYMIFQPITEGELEETVLTLEGMSLAFMTIEGAFILAKIFITFRTLVRWWGFL